MEEECRLLYHPSDYFKDEIKNLITKNKKVYMDTNCRCKQKRAFDESVASIFYMVLDKIKNKKDLLHYGFFDFVEDTSGNGHLGHAFSTPLWVNHKNYNFSKTLYEDFFKKLREDLQGAIDECAASIITELFETYEESGETFQNPHAIIFRPNVTVFCLDGGDVKVNIMYFIHLKSGKIQFARNSIPDFNEDENNGNIALNSIYCKGLYGVDECFLFDSIKRFYESVMTPDWNSICLDQKQEH